jgi:uncharacterized protein YecE (DUF72 family)
MMNRKHGRLRIGTSGYQYDHWKGIFYPADMPKRGWFSYYAESFDTVEINNTFYHLPASGAFNAWKEQAPEGFCYSLKFSRYGSHLKKLKNPQETIGRFMERAERLNAFLGPILVQLPPSWHVNMDRLAEFLRAAPKNRRWAFEFRDPSWLCEEVYRQLSAHNAALCIHDKIANHPRPDPADWTYQRFHGDRYAGNYGRQKLLAEAGRIREYLADGIDVFVYFNNDLEGFAIRNAADLRRYVLKE